MSKGTVPPPPDFTAVPPALQSWRTDEAIVRVFNPIYAPNGFNPGPGKAEVKGRFHFFASLTGDVVPVLYGAQSAEAAIAETIFHDVPVAGAPRVVLESRLGSASIVELAPTRELQLVELHGFGLARLGVIPEQLTSTDAAEYPQTIAWACALHASRSDVDGLVWMSKQFNSAKALVLFGDRVSPADLAVVDSPQPLGTGPGRAMVDAAANRAGILIVT